MKINSEDMFVLLAVILFFIMLFKYGFDMILKEVLITLFTGFVMYFVLRKVLKLREEKE